MKQPTIRKILPFIKKDRQKKTASYWSFPNKGTYEDGVLLGTEMGRLYLKEVNTLPPHSPILPMCVLSAVDNDKISSAKHGQIVGFFTEIELALKSR
ncbi:hypothetical protein ACO0LM_10420 [Undibacterium sp. Di26W]|uniref:hypothetical protein n=1 Tax=Undibacterium sp. Di26W TaxID=3413035 RepID=UPI003BF23553